MATSVQRTDQLFTYRDYLGWDEGRWELIDGEAFSMSPAPSTAHQRVCSELTAQAVVFFREHECEAFVAPFDVRLPDADEPDAMVATVVQPDLAVVCDPSKLDERGCRGAPDWVVEVLSPATAVKDQVRKRQLYERHGVRELWLVHPYDRVLTIYRRASEGGFGAADVREASGRTAVGLFPELEIDWKRVFARFPDP